MIMIGLLVNLKNQNFNFLICNFHYCLYMLHRSIIRDFQNLTNFNYFIFNRE